MMSMMRIIFSRDNSNRRGRSKKLFEITHPCLFVLQFAKFRQLLKEVIVLNDRLRKYAEKRLNSSVESCEDGESEHSTELICAAARADVSAGTSAENSSTLLNSSSRDRDSKPSEKRTVRIVSKSGHHEFLPALASVGCDAVAAAFIDERESTEIQVIVRFVLSPLCSVAR